VLDHCERAATRPVQELRGRAIAAQRAHACAIPRSRPTSSAGVISGITRTRGSA
jgi:hypothetical protein